MAEWSADQLRVAANIVAVARAFKLATRVPELVHLAAVLQESSMNDAAVGDAGESFGPYQIFQPAHPGTDQLAASPWANYAFHIVASEWGSAWQLYGLGWGDTSQRGAILERFVPAAQGSIAWDAGLGATRYAQALELYELVS